MRNQLAKLVEEPLWGSAARERSYETADAIIAALPDMVQPLVWEETERGFWAEDFRIYNLEHKRRDVWRLIQADFGNAVSLRFWRQARMQTGNGPCKSDTHPPHSIRLWHHRRDMMRRLFHSYGPAVFMFGRILRNPHTKLQTGNLVPSFIADAASAAGIHTLETPR